MPSTTSPGGLPIPLDADPVANTAQAIRNLANALDSGSTGSPAWVAYTPTWTMSSGGQALGNGTVVGRYRRIGKTIHYTIEFTIGSTTTIGTGQPQFTLPVAPREVNLMHYGQAVFIDGGAAVYNAYPLWIAASDVLRMYCDPTTAGNSLRGLTNLVPVTLASTDQILIRGTYEAA